MFEICPEEGQTFLCLALFRIMLYFFMSAGCIIKIMDAKHDISVKIEHLNTVRAARRNYDV